MVIALGRLGVREFDLASDADLNFILPDAADWLPALRSELLAFPDGAHDDQVDALTQFVEFCFRRKEWAGTYVGKDGRLVRPPRSRRPSKYPADA